MGARVNAVQGDGNTRFVEITLLSGGAAWLPPEDAEASISYSQPCGRKGLYNRLADGTDAISVNGNLVTVILAPQMLTAPGTVQASLVFNDAKLNRLTTFPFSVSVTGSPAAGAQITEDYIRLKWLEDKLDEYIRRITDGVGMEGPPGADGYTPVKGVDYGTPEEIAQIAQQAAQALAPMVEEIRGDINGLKKDVASLYNQIKQYHQNGGSGEPIVFTLDYSILDYAVLS